MGAAGAGPGASAVQNVARLCLWSASLEAELCRGFHAGTRDPATAHVSQVLQTKRYVRYVMHR